MKHLYRILKILLWSVIGVFIGSSLYKWYDYKTHPDLYTMQSAPWYLSIEFSAVLTMTAVIIILLIMWMIKKKCR